MLDVCGCGLDGLVLLQWWHVGAAFRSCIVVLLTSVVYVPKRAIGNGVVRAAGFLVIAEHLECLRVYVLKVSHRLSCGLLHITVSGRSTVAVVAVPGDSSLRCIECISLYAVSSLMQCAFWNHCNHLRKHLRRRVHCLTKGYCLTAWQQLQL